MYEVELGRDAKRFFERAPASLQRRLDKCFAQLKIDPHGAASAKRLSGNLRGMYRYRVGEYRVIYNIEDGTRRVKVLKIVHRSAAYE
jgi:mRNA interferase RelE/StbE